MGVTVDEVERLLELEEMVVLPGAGQGFGDLVFTGLATGKAQVG